MDMKKIIAGILASTVVGGAVSVDLIMPSVDMTTANAEDAEYTDSTYENIIYRKYGDHIEILKCKQTGKKEVIPAEIDGLPVTIIGERAFSNCPSITEVLIPDSITCIKRKAFFGCTNLISITIPDSISRIEEDAFSDTLWLKEKVAENPMVIVNNILIDARNCSGDIEIPDNVICIGALAFYYCIDITKVSIPESVKTIEAEAFRGCLNLKEIIIKNPECSINDDKGTICNSYRYYSVADRRIICIFNGTIYGDENSTAQAYAEKYGYKFEVIGENNNFPSPDHELLTGDMDGDNTINASDASYVLMQYSVMSTGKNNLFNDYQKISGDINGDGIIDSSDASLILGFYSYLLTGGTESDMNKWLESN